MSEELRLSLMGQSDQFTYKPRFGLFSQLVSTAIGDNSAYKPRYHNKGIDNKPKTEPSNMMTSPSKTGQLSSSFFGPLNPLANFTVHDVYIDESRRRVKQERESFLKGKIHESNFVPASSNRTSSAYPYMEQKQNLQNLKRRRDTEGNVIIEPRGFYTNCTSNLETKLGKIPRHMTEPYDNEKVVERERMKTSKSKQGEVPFQSSCYGPRLINKDRNIYNNDAMVKHKKQKSYSHNPYKHESEFRYASPPKKGIFGFISPYPQYIPCPPPKKSRPILPPGEKKEIFKSNNSEKSRPTPSITANLTNLRHHISHSFAKGI